jgi:hypothetical protein
MNLRNIQKSIEHLESARTYHISRSIYHSQQAEHIVSEIRRLTDEIDSGEVALNTFMESVGATKQ